MTANRDSETNGRGLTRRGFLQASAATAVGAAALSGSGRLLAAAPAKPDTLTVRAWGGAWQKALEDGVAKPFSAKTGIRVLIDNTEEEVMQTKIWTAQRQNRRPPVAVDWDTTLNATASAVRGATVDLSGLPNLSAMLPAAKPQGFDGWPMVNTYGYVFVMAYSTKAFPDGAPDSWMAMLDPKFKGRIALYDDGSGFTPVAEILGGGTLADIPDNMDPAWDFYRKLAKQQPLLGEDSDFTNWFQQGQIDIACTIMTNARAAKQSGIAVDWTVPKEGARYDTDCLWIPQGLPDNETHWARQFVNFALSADALETWANGLGLPPNRAGLNVPEDLRGDPAYPTTEADFKKLIQPSAKIVTRNTHKWYREFKQIMQG